jgi:hypothetical protein
MTSALDAYQPPTPTYDDAQQKPPGVGRIKAIAVIAIVLGCLGLFGSLAGIAGLLFGRQIQGAVSAPNQRGMPPEMVQVQTDMQNDLQAIQDRFMPINAVLVALTLVVSVVMPINAVLVALTLVVSVGLLIGGVQCLRRVVPARKVLLAACSAAFLVELLGAAVQIMIQAQTIPMTVKHTERMMNVGSGPAEVAEVAMTVARVAIVIGIVFGALWLLAKLVFFGISVWYLRRPSVCAYLDGPIDVDPSHALEPPQ